MRRVLYIGSKKFSAHLLDNVLRYSPESVCGIITLDDQEDVRSGFSMFHKLATVYGKKLEILSCKSELKKCIQLYKPDLCVVAGWYWIIEPELLSVPKLGFIAIHNSLLPKYRGGSPLVWSIIDGGEYVGYSIFQMTKEMDEGAILSQEQIFLSRQETVGDALEKIELCLFKSFNGVLDRYCFGDLLPRPQDLSQSTFCVSRKPTDGKVDWKQPATKVHDFIRAQAEPYPCAFSYLYGDKLTITRSEETGVKHFGRPGLICPPFGENVSVICGDGLVLNVELKGGVSKLKSGEQLG